MADVTVMLAEVRTGAQADDPAAAVVLACRSTAAAQALVRTLSRAFAAGELAPGVGPHFWVQPTRAAVPLASVDAATRAGYTVLIAMVDGGEQLIDRRGAVSPPAATPSRVGARAIPDPVGRPFTIPIPSARVP